MTDSILDSTKKVLGIEASYTAFDTDIVMHINSVFSTLHQLGIGPIEGFEIEDQTTQWSDFLGTETRLNSVKTYVYLRVRLLFDPPTTSFAIAAMQKQAEEYEWRLNVLREGVVYPTVITDEAVASPEAVAKLAAALSNTFVTTVEAGTNLSAVRPQNAVAVYWKFSAGVDVGVNGANIVNAQPGDTFHVASV